MLDQQAQLKRSYRLSLIGVFLAIVVIGLGAFTRLSDAGLGCPDWPGCYGHLMWPESADERKVAELNFPNAKVDTQKTWPEMVHRYFAGALGLLILGLAIFSWQQNKSFGRTPIKLPLALLVLVVLQAAFGMWTVTLKLLPQVVTAHLLGGFTTLSLLWLMSMRLKHRMAVAPMVSGSGPRTLAIVVLVAVIIQITLGGWTSSNYAALVCADLPTCQGQWLPATDFYDGFDLSHKIGPNYEGGVLDLAARTAIHMSHRIGAIVVTVLAFILAWCLATSGFKPLAGILLPMLILQLSLGLSNIWFALPLFVAVFHNIGGALLLLVLVKINYELYKNNQLSRYTA